MGHPVEQGWVRLTGLGAREKAHLAVHTSRVISCGSLSNERGIWPLPADSLVFFSEPRTGRIVLFIGVS